MKAAAARRIQTLTAIIAARPTRTARQALLLLIPLMAAAWMVRPNAFFYTAAFPIDGHARISLEEAMNAQFCGQPGRLSSQHSIAAVLGSDARLMNRPLEQIVVWKAGSLDTYCGSIDRAFLNNENSLMLLMRAALGIQPHQSAAAIGRWLAAIRLVMIVLFAYVLLEAGAALPFTFLCLLAIFEISRAMKPFELTIYSFFVADLLVMTALYILAWRRLAGRLPAAVFGACVAAGVLTAFFVNMRTSHFPVYAVAFVFFLVAAGRRSSGIRRPIFVAVGLVAFVVGYASFGRLFIRPLIPSGPDPYVNHPHHGIAHPLVLALGVPPNPLAQREGISWNDDVGLTLARRMVPDAVYLGRGYEEGLFLLYGRLWLQYPAEMRAIYRAKLAQAGTGMFDWDRTNSLHNRVSTILGRIVPVVTGGQILVAYCVVLAIAAWRFLRHQSQLAGLFTFLTMTAILLMLEAAAIASRFLMQYDAYLLLYTAMVLLLAGQLLLDLICRTVGQRASMSIPTPSSAP